MNKPYLDPRIVEVSASTGLTYLQLARFASIAGQKLPSSAVLALVGELLRRREAALISFDLTTGMIVITVPSPEGIFSFASDALFEEVYVQGKRCDALGRGRSLITALSRKDIGALLRGLKHDWVAARISDAAAKLRKLGQLDLAADAERAARKLRQRSR